MEVVKLLTVTLTLKKLLKLLKLKILLDVVEVEES